MTAKPNPESSFCSKPKNRVVQVGLNGDNATGANVEIKFLTFFEKIWILCLQPAGDVV
jgi:hypothetical protein